MSTEKKQAELIKEISGVNPLKCMKCGKCSASCPSFNEMDIKPHQFVSYVANENIEELVNSKSLWKCLSCYSRPHCLDTHSITNGIKGGLSTGCPKTNLQVRSYPFIKSLPVRYVAFPSLQDPELPQQLLVSAFRRYRR